jgi:hypothetical protein
MRFKEWVRQILPRDAPLYACRLLSAAGMLMLGKELRACEQMEFARCEAAAPDFAELIARREPRAHDLLTQAQRWQIDVLLKIWPS